MANIQKRVEKYRIRLRPQGLPCLSITFSTYEDAQNWVDEHEQKYIEDPAKYQSWIRFNRTVMKGNGIFHVHRPLEDF